MIDEEKVQAEFRRLCELVQDADLSGSGSVVDFHEELVSLVEFCRRELPHHRVQVLHAFSCVVRGEIAAPEELVPYAMHYLRLPEVLTFAEEWSKEPGKNSRCSIDRREYLARLRAAYEDAWEDANLWRSPHPDNPIAPPR